MLILCFRCWLWTKLTHFPAQWTFTNSWAFFLFFIAHLEQLIIPWLVSSNVSARRFHVKNLIWKSLQNLEENVCHRFLLSKVADSFTIERHHWAKLQEASLQGDPTEQSYRQLHYKKTPLSKVACSVEKENSIGEDFQWVLRDFPEQLFQRTLVKGRFCILVVDFELFLL